MNVTTSILLGILAIGAAVVAAWTQLFGSTPREKVLGSLAVLVVVVTTVLKTGHDLTTRLLSAFRHSAIFALARADTGLSWGGNTNAPVITTAEKAPEMIRQAPLRSPNPLSAQVAEQQCRKASLSGGPCPAPRWRAEAQGEGRRGGP